MFFDVSQNNDWHKLPNHGWDFRVVLLTFWLLLKDWAVTFVLKNLDSLWKALGTALGLVVTYLAELLFGWKPMVAPQFFMVLIIVTNIVVYARSKVTVKPPGPEYVTLPQHQIPPPNAPYQAPSRVLRAVGPGVEP